MAYRIIWTERAERTLKKAVDYIAADNPTAAARFRDAVFERIELAAAVPGIGTRYATASDDNTRQIVVDRYRIFYRVFADANEVKILLVWHGSRREPRLR